MTVCFAPSRTQVMWLARIKALTQTLCLMSLGTLGVVKLPLSLMRLLSTRNRSGFVLAFVLP